MNSKKTQRLEKLLMRREIADRTFFMAIPFYTEASQHSRPILKGKDEEYLAATAGLVSKGCDRESLSVILDLAAAIKLNEGKCSLPKAKAVKSLTSRMKRLAKDIRAAELTHFMFIVNEQETGYTDLGPDEFEDLSLTYPFLALPKWLEMRASMYDQWSRLASQKVLPKDFGVARLARVCVALYVQYATGRTYFPKVLNLLKSAGFEVCNATQLSREVKEFETGYTWCRDWLKAQFAELGRDPFIRSKGERAIGVRPPSNSVVNSAGSNRKETKAD